jgi:hypothetical protein
MIVPITLDSLELPSELVWTDEYSWQKVRVAEKLSLTGVRHIFESILPTESGRPITLTGSFGWIDKADVDTLYLWAQDLDKEMLLTMHDETTHNVRFRHIEMPVVEVVLLVPDSSYPTDDTLYVLTLKLEMV